MEKLWFEIFIHFWGLAGILAGFLALQCNKHIRVLGFKIAEEDLKLRGPGEFFGSRQHGLLTFKIANIYCDKQLLAQTSIAANEILANDRKLKSPENAAIHRQILKIFDTKVTFS